MGKSKFSSEDMINRMPENVITNILDRLPIQEAVRTSILSRNWRFNWTLLTQLVFDKDFFGYLLSKNLVHLFYKRNLVKVLLQLKGSITKFDIYIPAKDRKQKNEYNIVMYDGIVEDINHWILFLSTKGVKEFNVINMCDMPLKLPNHIFSCQELIHLKLRNCCLHHVARFHCFPKLLGFEFDRVKFGSCKYGKLLAPCPLLENLEISYNAPDDRVILGEIAKLVNLKMLSLLLSKVGDTVVTSSDILQLMGSLPKLEKLDLDFRFCDVLAKAGANKMLAANLHCLKTLALKEIDFENHIAVECACDLINSLPNLQTLEMSRDTFEFYFQRRPVFSKLVCSIKGNLQLKNVVFEQFKGTEIEVDFIKSLLDCSSLLKKMVIQLGACYYDIDRFCTVATKLLKLPRASPVAEIHFL